MSEFIEPTIEEIEVPQRVNPFCVISKETFGEYAVRDIQTNSGWSENPYGEDYAVVPDDMVADILETRGFCDIKLSKDKTTVTSFTAREIPEIPTSEPGPTLEDRVATLEETVANGGGSGEDVWGEMALAIEEGVNEV